MAELDDDAHIEVLCTFEDVTPILQVVGDIDLSTSPTLREAIHKATADRSGQVVFDLGEVTFMDSSGLAVLLEVAAKGTDVLLRSPSDTVRRVIETTGLSSTLRMQP